MILSFKLYLNNLQISFIGANNRKEPLNPIASTNLPKSVKAELGAGSLERKNIYAKREAIIQ